MISIEVYQWAMDDNDALPIYQSPKNNCSNVPCRVLVIVLCILMIIAGFIFFVLGCLFTWAESTAYNYLREPIDEYFRFANLMEDKTSLSILLKALLEYSEPMGQIAFWIGLSIMIFCSFGLYSSITQSKFSLFVFASMLFAKVLIIAVIIVTYHTNPDSVVDTFRGKLEESVKGYVGFRAKDKHSLLLNVMMPYMSCCGVEGGEDFAGSKKFDYKYIDKDNTRSIRQPFPCCKLAAGYEQPPNNCPETFDERNSNSKTGCWPILKRNILATFTRVSYAVIVTTLFEFFLGCFSIYAALMVDDKSTT